MALEDDGVALEKGEIIERAIAFRERGDVDAAIDLLVPLYALFSGDAEVAYQLAWCYDKAGREAEALPCYEIAMASGGLAPADRRGALLGLGSTHRVLGHTAESIIILARAAAEFPADSAIRTFFALSHYETGDHPGALAILLELLTDPAADASVLEYVRALREYAAQLRDASSPRTS
jgi:tetratricopeptide (TPR) repeat protein